jgi:hypothetical protein
MVGTTSRLIRAAIRVHMGTPQHGKGHSSTSVTHVKWTCKCRKIPTMCSVFFPLDTTHLVLPVIDARRLPLHLSWWCYKERSERNPDENMWRIWNKKLEKYSLHNHSVVIRQHLSRLEPAMCVTHMLHKHLQGQPNERDPPRSSIINDEW